MINNFSLLFSILAVVFVVIRAAMLDRMLPWFKPFDPALLQKRRRNQARPRA